MRLFTRAYPAAGALLAGLSFVLAPDGRFASLPWAAACALATTAIAIGIRRHRPRRVRIWVYLGATIGLWGLAALLFPFLSLRATTAAYHTADLFYLPGYLTVALATAALVRSMGGLRVAGVEAAIGALTLSTFLSSLVVAPSFEKPGAGLAVLTTLFPLCDSALLMLLLRLLFSRSSRLAATRLLAAAAALLVLCDVAYFSPIFANGATAGRLIAAGYTLSYVLFGGAALHRSMRLVPRPACNEIAPKRLLALLAAAPAAIPIAVALDKLVLGQSDIVGPAVIGAGVVVLVMIRIGGVLSHLDELRLRAEASEQKLRMVFDSAAIGVSIGSDGMMSETNRALQEMLGRSADELSRLHYTEATHPADRSLALDVSDEVLAGDRPSHTFEKRLVRSDGSSLWVSVTLSRAHDGTFGIALISDITARKRLEDDLRQAQKMEAVGKLAGGIAHDFNNVMTAVSGCADLLLQEIPEGDARRDRVEVIAQSAARATDLTRQLLAFSRRQVFRLEPLDLVDIVSKLRPMLERLLPPNVVVDYDLTEGAVARIDGAQFEQVVLNLALNARDSMPDGGRLTISVRGAGDAAELVVADDGAGMDESTQAHIFEPFFTSKASGTGLGLATVDGIVAQSGGTIEVASSPGEGSVFVIRLPRADEPARALPQLEQPQLEQPGEEHPAPGRILLADDEELVRRVTTEMLSRLGYEVVATESGEAALEHLAAAAGFDALVTDVAMTGIDGATLACRARELRPGLPVLFISGYPAEVLTGRRMIGADDEVLTKPFTPAELAERIELVRRRALEVAPA
jgi:two-component system cell cycle sensor histidine kinase/response regulator CckA